MPTDPAFLARLTDTLVGPGIGFSKFCCAEETVNWFLNDAARRHHEQRVSLMTCWLYEGDLAGYYTTSMSTVILGHPPQKETFGLRNIFFKQDGNEAERFPSLLIGMLGVCQRYEGKGLGPHMVRHAIGQAQILAVRTGCRFVSVDSAPTAKAIGMYKKAGFTIVEGQKRKAKPPDTLPPVSMVFDLGPRNEGARKSEAATEKQS